MTTETLANTKPKTHLQGLRTVAAIEIAKGVGALILCMWLLTAKQKDFGDLIANLLDRLNVDPEHSFAMKLITMADRITPRNIEVIAAVGLVYTAIRFIEGYGLWKARTWAEYFAMISGAVYLPWEVWEFIRRPNLFHAVLILINIAVVLYIAYVRFAVHREHVRERAIQPS